MGCGEKGLKDYMNSINHKGRVKLIPTPRNRNDTHFAATCFIDNNFLGEGTAGNQIDAMRNAAENARANLMRGEEEKEKIIARKKAELTRYVEIALKGKTEEDIRMEKMEALLAYAARRDGKKTA